MSDAVIDAFASLVGSIAKESRDKAKTVDELGWEVTALRLENAELREEVERLRKLLDDN